MNLDNVTRDDWIVGGLALFLAIALLFFPWFDISVSIGAFSASASFSATGAPDGWLGILAMLAALAVVVDLAVERLSPQTQFPTIGGSRPSTRFILAAAAAGFMLLKFLFHINHFSDLGWGFYISVLIAAGLLFVAMQARSGAPIAPSRPAPPPPPPSSTGPSGPSSPAGSAGPPRS